jgi:hypothetical protein
MMMKLMKVLAAALVVTATTSVGSGACGDAGVWHRR